MNGIEGEQGVARSKGSDARQEQASLLGQGHVNRIKSILGLDQEHSALSKLASHTKRKMAELEASKASTASGTPDWAASMKPESFGKGFIKANSKQFMISVGIFSLMAFWLCVIRTVHHTDDPNHSGTSERAQQIASSRASNPPQALPPQQAEVSGDVPASFGSPNTSFGSPNPFGYQQPAVPQVPQLAVAQAPAVAPQSATPQMFSPYPSMYSPPTPGYGTRVPASNFTMQQQPSLIAARQHAAARYKVVVNR